jgi:hypothetical protein
MLQLERLAPAQKRGECIDLDASRVRMSVGRSEDCDVRLYSATASRLHAELRRDADGSWWIAPLEGCEVRADGEPVGERCELCEGLSLELGRDRLRCQTPAAAGDTALVPPLRRRNPAWHRPAMLVAAALVLVLVFLRTCG